MTARRRRSPAGPTPIISWRDAIFGRAEAGSAFRNGGGGLVVVTNVRGFGPPAPNRPSRRALVTDLLQGRDPDAIAIEGYNAVNLIAIADGRARFLSNRPEPVRSSLASGLYGLSNGTLDAPWPKTLRLKSILLD